MKSMMMTGKNNSVRKRLSMQMWMQHQVIDVLHSRLLLASEEWVGEQLASLGEVMKHIVDAPSLVDWTQLQYR